MFKFLLTLPGFVVIPLEGDNSMATSISGKYVVGKVNEVPAVWDLQGKLVSKPCFKLGWLSDVDINGLSTGISIVGRDNYEGWYYDIVKKRCSLISPPIGVEIIDLSINSMGDMSGTALLSDSTKAFSLKHSGDISFLPDLKGLHNFANEMNDQGTICGFVSDPEAPLGQEARACIWTDNNTLVLLPTLGGQSVASSVNDLGYVVGRSALFYGDRPPWHAFICSPDGVITDIGTAGEYVHSIALSVNNSETVVGWSGDDPLSAEAFIYNDGILKTLNELVNSNVWWFAVAHDIDDRGYIVGWGYVGTYIRAFLLVPKGKILDYEFEIGSLYYR